MQRGWRGCHLQGQCTELCLQWVLTGRVHTSCWENDPWRPDATRLLSGQPTAKWTLRRDNAGVWFCSRVLACGSGQREAVPQTISVLGSFALLILPIQITWNQTPISGCVSGEHLLSHHTVNARSGKCMELWAQERGTECGLESKDLRRVHGREASGANISMHVVLSCISHIQLFVTLWTIAYQVPLSMGFSRKECWSGLPCPPSGGLPNPGMEPMGLLSPALAGRFFTTSATNILNL